ncbi:hypothetical protein ACUUL3_14950 [Thiovibrio sp. JS02]
MAKQAAMPARALIVSDDASFAETMKTILQRWGMHAAHCQNPTVQAGEGMAVVLLDIRGQTGKPLTFLYAVKGRWPGVEAILINRPDNIQPAIAGMKAGAADEIIAPFDTETLKCTILAALDRRRKKKRSLLQRFGDAMAAATFAQAGEFATAVALLEEPEEARGPAAAGKNANEETDHG